MKGWQGVGEWFNGVTKWFNEIDIGIKIGVGLLLFAAACALVIISAPTGAAGLTGAIAAYTGTSSTIAAATVTSMAIAFAVGIASATAMSAAGALLSGGDVVEAMTNAAADAVFWGGVFAFVSAGVNALKTVARTTYNAKLPGSSQTGGQACSTVNQCFKEGTLVETEEGLKPIEEIAVGDKVLAYDETTGEQAYKPVVQLFRNTTNEWYHVHAGGEEIICTGGHPFYVVNAVADRQTVNYEGCPENVNGAWICAGELKVCDKVLLSNGTTAIIEAVEVERLSKPETTYNFEVADSHTYYVSDSKILVHNMCKRAAMREAKRSENIPQSQKPDEVILEKSVRGADGKFYQPKTYRFGDKFIRDDFGGHLFADGATMGSHFNAGRIMNGRYVGNGMHFFYGG